MTKPIFSAEASLAVDWGGEPTVGGSACAGSGKGKYNLPPLRGMAFFPKTEYSVP